MKKRSENIKGDPLFKGSPLYCGEWHFAGIKNDIVIDMFKAWALIEFPGIISGKRGKAKNVIMRIRLDEVPNE